MDESQFMVDAARAAYKWKTDVSGRDPIEEKPHLYHLFAVQDGERAYIGTRYMGRTVSLSGDMDRLYHILENAEDWPEAAEVLVFHPESERVFLLDDDERWQDVGPRGGPGQLETPVAEEEQPEDDQHDNAPLPDIEGKELLAYLADGKTFRQFTELDWSSYAGAPEGSVISYEVPGQEGWTFIVGPSDLGRGSGPFIVEALLYTEEGEVLSTCRMDEAGWEDIS